MPSSCGRASIPTFSKIQSSNLKCINCKRKQQRRERVEKTIFEKGHTQQRNQQTMSDSQFSPIVDADGHVLEPGDMYQKYIDPQYRERAIRIEVDERGHENLIIDNKPYQSESMRGNLGAIGGIGMDRKKLLSRGQGTYAEGSPAGGYDPKARLKVMDEEEIDIAILYPTLGIFWEGAVQDPKLATAYTSAYNRWITEFCRENPKRLY